MMIFRRIFFVATWIVTIPFILALIIAGLVLVPFALGYEKLFKRWPKLLWLWGNDEEGCPDWWLNMDKPKVKDVFPCWWWYAIRNPVNNMRFLFDDDKPFHTYGWIQESMEAHDLLEQKVRKAWRWRFRGVLCGYRRVWLNDNGHYSEFWIGWKVGSKVPGLGFATQLRLNREIGT